MSTTEAIVNVFPRLQKQKNASTISYINIYSSLNKKMTWVIIKMFYFNNSMLAEIPKHFDIQKDFVEKNFGKWLLSFTLQWHQNHSHWLMKVWLNTLYSQIQILPLPSPPKMTKCKCVVIVAKFIAWNSQKKLFFLYVFKLSDLKHILTSFKLEIILILNFYKMKLCQSLLTYCWYFFHLGCSCFSLQLFGLSFCGY